MVEISCGNYRIVDAVEPPLALKDGCERHDATEIVSLFRQLHMGGGKILEE
jgi:hypothetical protein